MRTFIAGDLQGCLTPLQCLLESVSFDPTCDRLWLVGDLVNRGPQCLDTLRFLKHMSDEHQCIQTVLGNHDLHLLAIAHTEREPKRSDTLNEILAAPDCTQLLDWLISQPIMIVENEHVLCHAGINPHWGIKEALAYAKEVEQALSQKDTRQAYFENMYGNKPDRFSHLLSGTDRLRTITNYFTRMRLVGPDGELDFNNKSTPNFGDTNATFKPWFERANADWKNYQIYFGHWAALQGVCPATNIHALDTGCVWGGSLTLLERDTGIMHQCSCDAARESA